MARAIPEDEKERGLLALAVYGPSQASERTGIAETNLRRWRDQDPVRFAEIRTNEAAKLRAQAAVEAEDLAARERYLAHKALDRVEEAIDTDRLEKKDYANLIKTLDVGSGIHTDKAEKLRDRPAMVIEHKVDMGWIERTAQKLGIVESTAVEIETPQLEQEAQGQLQAESGG